MSANRTAAGSAPPVLGVFGGAFDPPHLGHAMVPAYLRLRGLVDRLLVVPCADHPLGKDLSPFGRRMALTRAAMASYGEAVEVSDLEARLLAAHGGPSYTLRLLEAVAVEHPGTTVRLVVGSDIMGQVQRWHRWDEIERRFPPIVVPRTGHAPEDACALPAVSSTQVRAWLRDGGPGAEEGLLATVPRGVLALLRQPASAPCWVVGGGHVATHAVPWLQASGATVMQLGARALLEGAAVPSELVSKLAPGALWVLVRDPELPAVARALAALPPSQLPTSVPVLHGAGAWRACEILAPLAERGNPVGTLHPICSLRSERASPSPLPHAAFGIEGDPSARAVALAWVGQQPWIDLQGLTATQRRAYHAGFAVAANHLSVPYVAARRVLVDQGHEASVVENALLGLMRSALDNLEALGVPDGITGPVARGDDAAVRAHIEALDDGAAALYRTLAERLRVIVAEGRKSPSAD